ncbi:MAG: RHS repeat-associated core domain-containing protein [Vulcanimicrobiaceae bacterium]
MDGDFARSTVRQSGSTVRQTEDGRGGLRSAHAAYTYDASDNLLAATGPGAFTAKANNANQLTQVTKKGVTATWTFDKDGNLLGDGTRAYTWDAENRLLSVTLNATKQTSTFAYDALGRRVAITDSGITTRYRWCGERICAARNAAGAITARFFPQGEIDGTASRYYATDRLGSVRVLMDNAGRTKGTAVYGAYGRTTTTGEMPTFGYAGMFYHKASGLYLTRYRAYNPDVGRWISRDPIGEVGGMNLYGYVGDNPASFIDPTGLCSKSNFTPDLLLLILGTEILGGGPEDPLADAAVAAEIAAAENAAIAADDLVTVTHFTSAEGALAIGEGGTLNAGSFVTTSDLSSLSPSEVESTLEIGAGKGAFSTSFQTPASNLGPAFNGPFTSGNAPQFQLINPTPITTFNSYTIAIGS